MALCPTPANAACGGTVPLPTTMPLISIPQACEFGSQARIMGNPLDEQPLCHQPVDGIRPFTWIIESRRIVQRPRRARVEYPGSNSGPVWMDDRDLVSIFPDVLSLARLGVLQEWALDLNRRTGIGRCHHEHQIGCRPVSEHLERRCPVRVTHDRRSGSIIA